MTFLTAIMEKNFMRSRIITVGAIGIVVVIVIFFLKMLIFALTISPLGSIFP
jgi:hypothetical protein